MKVRDIMTKEVLSLSPSTKIVEAAEIMLSKRVGGLPVVDENQHIVGILTEGDFIGKNIEIPHGLRTIPELLGHWMHGSTVEEILDESKNTPVSEVMSKPVVFLNPDVGLTEAVNTMLRQGHTRMPVVEGQKLVGIVSRRDILKAMVNL